MREHPWVSLVREATKYNPRCPYDPYEEDCSGMHNKFYLTESGLGPSIRFSDNVHVFISDETGDFEWVWKDGSYHSDPPPCE